MSHRLMIRSLIAALVCGHMAGAVDAQQPSPSAAAQNPAAPNSAAPSPAPANAGAQSATPPAAQAGGATAVPTPPAPSAAAVERAAEVLAEARKAMGGDKLSAVTTVVANGRTQRVRGNNLVPIEFEIAIELPDKYVRKDEVPAEESEPTSTGFAGGEVIQYPAPGARRGGGPALPPGGAGRPGGPAPPAPTPAQIEAQNAARLLTAKQEFARLALGMFAGTLQAYPMTFAYAAVAQAPQGTADVLDVRGEGNLSMRLFIHSQTRLPVMVSWQAPPTGVVVTTPGQPPPRTVAPGAVIVNAPAAPPASASQDEKDSYARDVAALRQKAQTTPIEYRLYYADYRDVDGVKLPFRLRRAIGPDTTEETTVDRYRLNTRIDPRKFAVPPH